MGDWLRFHRLPPIRNPENPFTRSPQHNKNPKRAIPRANGILATEVTMNKRVRTLILGLIFGLLGGMAQAGELTDQFNATRKLAERGQPDAMYRLGQMYELGLGVSADTRKAYAWYQKAANDGQADAAYQLGYAYYWGKAGKPKDYQQALDWFSLAAEKGNSKAMTYLSKMYALGRGVPRDKARAEDWSDKAHLAEQQAREQATRAAAARAVAARTAPQPAPVALAEPAPPPAEASAASPTVAETTAAQLAPATEPAVQAKPEPKPKAKAKPKPKAKPRPKARPKPRASVQEQILAGSWNKGSRPALFLPSDNVKCKKADDTLRCSSRLITDHQYGTPFRFRYISTLSDFSTKGDFKVNHRAQLIEVLAEGVAGYTASEGEEESAPKATTETIQALLSRRRDQLDCQLVDDKTITCTGRRNKVQRFRRS